MLSQSETSLRYAPQDGTPLRFAFAHPCKGEFDYTLLPMTDKEKSGQNPCKSA
jgi:hypothetical protein